MAGQAKTAGNKEKQQQGKKGRTVLHKDMVYEVRHKGQASTSGAEQLRATMYFEAR